MSFRFDWAYHIRRGKEKAFAKGYEQGAKDMAEYFSEQVIYSLHKDAILSMSIDIDTLERVVEVIEAVRDVGKA
jgi:CRISPR/Cas system-associated endonuclease Cas3-HD